MVRHSRPERRWLFDRHCIKPRHTWHSTQSRFRAAVLKERGRDEEAAGESAASVRLTPGSEPLAATTSPTMQCSLSAGQR